MQGRWFIDDVARVVVLALMIVAAGITVWAQSSSPPVDEAVSSTSRTAHNSDFSWLKTSREGLEWMRDRGFSGQLSLVNDWSHNVDGGAISPVSFERYSLDVGIKLDAQKAFHWAGATGFVRLKHHNGDVGGDYVGDAQGFSNIDGVPRTHLYELWGQQSLFNERLGVKFGKIDANSEFAVVHSAGDFLNGAMGYSPTILAFPTYPEPQPGINLFVRPKHYQVGVGVFRTNKAGSMSLLEGGREWVIGEKELGGRVSFGFWRLGGPVERFDGDKDSGILGFYSVFEQTVWSRDRSSSAGQQRLSAFLQYGHANGELNCFRRHVGVGGVLESPFAVRPHDALGLALTSVGLSDEPEAGFQLHGAETTLELYYKLNIRPFLSIVPDLQYIHNAGGIRSQGNAVVVTPRLVISF